MLNIPAMSVIRPITMVSVNPMTLLPGGIFQPGADVAGIRIISGWVMLTTNGKSSKLWAGRSAIFYPGKDATTLTATGKRSVRIEVVFR